MTIYTVIGLMSGTSLDGIDVALVETDGERHLKANGFLTVPYTDELRQKIRVCFNKAPDTDAEHALTIAHADAVKKLLQEKNISPDKIDLIGFHGQTIAHAPDRGYTCQLGDGALLSRLTGIKVVNDFRTADVKAGGQGAPLVPVYHQALAAKLEKPVVFLNIGGVANVTYIDDTHLIAFDTGPGNALIDDWMLERTGKKYDQNGSTATAGKTDVHILDQLLSHPFFGIKPPKSLDRNTFASNTLKNLSTEDGAATLSAFTVQAIAKAQDHFPKNPQRWIVCGGGRLNAFLMNELNKTLGVPVGPIEGIGCNGDATEAEAFAYLAVRSIKGLPLSFPSTTGVRQPTTGGRLNAA